MREIDKILSELLGVEFSPQYYRTGSRLSLGPGNFALLLFPCNLVDFQNFFLKTSTSTDLFTHHVSGGSRVSGGGNLHSFA